MRITLFSSLLHRHCTVYNHCFAFVDLPSVLWYCWLGLLTCKNCLPYNLYCVWDVKHCTIQYCTITGVGNVKQVSFKPGPEDCYRRCGSDKIWQTVPDTCSGDRESSVTDSKESGMADNQWWRWTGTESLTCVCVCFQVPETLQSCCLLPAWLPLPARLQWNSCGTRQLQFLIIFLAHLLEGVPRVIGELTVYK